jgi:thermitase
MRVRQAIVAALSFLLFGGPCFALYVRLQGERISITANQDPLVDILTRLAQSGVSVRIDPQVKGKVTAQVKDADVQEVMDELLGKFGYVLIWDVIDGPLGPIPKLGEVQVFFPGNKQKIQPLLGTNDNYEVTTGPSGGAEFVRDEILIGFKPGTRRDAVDLLLSQIGGTLIDSIPGLGIYRIRLMPGTNILALIQQLEKNSMVAGVEPNYIVDAPTPVVENTGAAAFGDISVPAPLENVASLAILDSGLMAEGDLGKVVVGRYDATNPDRPLGDSLGHGTQMALIAAGAVSPQQGTDALSVPLVAIRAFDDNGRASNFGLMRSMNYALEKGSRVMNMSWGTEVKSDFLATSVAYAQSKGAILVAAAGNEPTQKAMYPAAYRNVVAVSAIDANGNLWKSSNYGNFVSVAAPGYATFPVGYKGAPGAYEGTSISSAYVSRALTLYFAKHPKATSSEAIQALQDAVTDSGARGRDVQYGYGSLDAAAMSRFLR